MSDSLIFIRANTTYQYHQVITVHPDKSTSTQQIATSGMGSIGSSDSVAWSPNGELVAILATTAAPYFWIYKVSAGSFDRLTTNVPDQAWVTTSGQPRAIAWSPDDRFLALAGNGPGGYAVFERVGDSLHKLSTPAAASTFGMHVCWSPAGDDLAVMTSTNSSSVFRCDGNVFNAVASLAVAGGTTAAYSPDGRVLVCGSSTGSIYAFWRDGDTYTSIGNLAAGVSAVRDIEFSPDGELLVVCGATGVAVFTHAQGTLAKLSAPFSGTVPAATWAIRWDATGNYLFGTGSLAGEAWAYRRVGTVLAREAALPGGAAPYANAPMDIWPKGSLASIVAPISGHVLDGAGNPLARKVRVYRRDNGSLVGETMSDAGTGIYALPGYNGIEHFVIVFDDVCNAKVFDHVIPVV